jgi:hypothetical protein
VIAEIAAANAAFQVIKTAIKNSGEIASAGKAIVDYFSATHARLKKKSKKRQSENAPTWRSFLPLSNSENKNKN